MPSSRRRNRQWGRGFGGFRGSVRGLTPWFCRLFVEIISGRPSGWRCSSVIYAGARRRVADEEDRWLGTAGREVAGNRRWLHNYPATCFTRIRQPVTSGIRSCAKLEFRGNLL